MEWVAGLHAFTPILKANVPITHNWRIYQLRADMRNSFLLNADKTFKVSKPAVVLLITTIILLGFLAVGTIQNLDRGQKLMELSFLRQGTTMIQSFEAATRTSLLFHIDDLCGYSLRRTKKIGI